MTTFDKLSEWESPQAKAIREEIEAVGRPDKAMSEDPVKYDADVPWGLQLQDDDKRPGEPDTVRSEWEAQQIRIEALQAAATIISAAVSSGRPDDPTVPALELAKQFAAWLETGE